MNKNETLAFYLKYRPQSLDNLVGQQSVKKILLSAFQNNKLSHAYLFVGPRGCGKTSTARILAKMVNCEGKGDPSTSLRTGSGKSEVPCNKCSICLSITDGSNLDLIEIDAASNRGIEDIRSLREKIKLAPTSSKKKVYIIDEVHMLTQEAFNALLKTLEEPPAHALFILATTDANKIPQTILSRTQRLDFKLASIDELKEALEKIIKEEKIDIDEEALSLLIKKADGSFRDGVKLLDQIHSLGGKITSEKLDNLSLSKFDDLLDLIQNLLNKKVAESLMIIQKQVEKGGDVKDLCLSLMDTLRNLMLIKNGVGEIVESQFTEDKYERLVKLAEEVTNKDLIKSLDMLQNSLEKLKFASIQSLPLELAVVEICGNEDTTPLIARSERAPEGEKQSSASMEMEDHHGPIEIGPRDDKTKPSSKLGESTAPEIVSNSNSSDILILKEKWTFVLETIRPFNFSLEALLRSIIIRECSETEVLMEVPYSFHQRILEAPKNRDLLESILSDILGRSIKVSTVLGSRPARKEDIANIEVAQDDEIIRVAAEIFNSDSIN